MFLLHGKQWIVCSPCSLQEFFFVLVPMYVHYGLLVVLWTLFSCYLRKASADHPTYNAYSLFFVSALFFFIALLVTS